MRNLPKSRTADLTLVDEKKTTARARITASTHSHLFRWDLKAPDNSTAS
jgi:hypothetical protein